MRAIPLLPLPPTPAPPQSPSTQQHQQKQPTGLVCSTSPVPWHKHQLRLIATPTRTSRHHVSYCHGTNRKTQARPALQTDPTSTPCAPPRQPLDNLAYPFPLLSCCAPHRVPPSFAMPVSRFLTTVPPVSRPPLVRARLPCRPMPRPCDLHVVFDYCRVFWTSGILKKLV